LRRRFFGICAAFAIFLFLVVAMGIQATSSSSAGLVPTTNDLADNLSSAMGISSEYLVSAEYYDHEEAVAVVTTSHTFLKPIEGDSFLLISSGTAQPSSHPEGWLGEPAQDVSFFNNNPSGTCPLGGSAFDIATLSLTLRAPEWANSISFNFRFLSEEYPEYVGREYNDFFSCSLDGENIVFDTEGKIINVNNNFFDPNITPTGTCFNGATSLLTTRAEIVGGSTFNLVFTVGDVGDDILDSAVFIDNFAFSGDQISGSKTESSFFAGDSMRVARSLSVVGGVAVGVTAATAILAALGPTINAAIANLPIPSQIRSFLKFYGANIFQKVDKVKLLALAKAPFIAKEELTALGISVSIVTIVYSFVETNGLQQFFNPAVLAVVLPSTFVSVAIVTSTKVFSDAFCARISKTYRKFSLWITGFLTFIISGILFLFPFSSPGITRYQSIEITQETKGLIVLSKTLLLLTLCIVFPVLFLLGFKIIADTGLLFTLMSACYSLVPLKYLSGKVLFDYNKKYSLIAFAFSAFLFVSFTINLFPVVAFLPVGIISAALAIITIKKLKLSL
jgi:hypothetical protein